MKKEEKSQSRLGYAHDAWEIIFLSPKASKFISQESAVPIGPFILMLTSSANQLYFACFGSAVKENRKCEDHHFACCVSSTGVGHGRNFPASLVQGWCLSESQSGWDWKGPLVVILSSPPTKQGHQPSTERLPHGKREPPVLQVVSSATGPGSGHHCKEPGCSLPSDVYKHG